MQTLVFRLSSLVCACALARTFNRQIYIKKMRFEKFFLNLWETKSKLQQI